MCLKQLDVTSCNTPGLTHIYILPSVDGPVPLSPSTVLHTAPYIERNMTVYRFVYVLEVTRRHLL